MCENKSFFLQCIVGFLFDDGQFAVVDAVWKRDGEIIDDTTPGIILIRNFMSPPKVVGVKIKHFNGPHKYTCTVNSATQYVDSSVYVRRKSMF